MLSPVFAAVGAGWWRWREGSSAVQCKAKADGNRLVITHTELEDGKEPGFPWKKLWALLLEDIWYLLLAVVASKH